MTHGSIYAAAPAVRSVFHAHSPEIWREAARLGLPRTGNRIPYGSPEMAEEVKRLVSSSKILKQGIIVMGGHEDGVVSFGDSIDAAGANLLIALAHALRSGH